VDVVLEEVVSVFI